MSLTEREKEIALEVAHRRCKTYRHKAEEPYSFDDDCMIHAFDTFLSRIREEQEAVAWRYIDCSDEGTCCHMYNEIRQGEPLFTTPPATLPSGNRSECDCSELAEALEMYRGQYANDGKSGYAEEALANHAKRMNGGE